MVIALWRTRLKISYEASHLGHIVLAVVAVAAAVAHRVGWSFYLSSSWKRALWIALPSFWVGLLVCIRAVKHLIMLRHPYRVDGLDRPRRFHRRGTRQARPVAPACRRRLPHLRARPEEERCRYDPLCGRLHLFAARSEDLLSGERARTYLA